MPLHVDVAQICLRSFLLATKDQPSFKARSSKKILANHDSKEALTNKWRAILQHNCSAVELLPFNFLLFITVPSSRKGRSKKEAEDNTNRPNPGGHERKILQKLQRTEQKRKETASKK
uniref:Uncharacterized protein n=1 Tax=Anolis carolinensis TaxID=28377 RepID=A0A803THU6_ANOCA